MIQNARSSDSRSLLREAEYAVFVLDDNSRELYFRKLALEVVENRNNPNITYTGAKNLREQILAYLRNLGLVETANVWCRNITVDMRHINELSVILYEKFKENNIYGVFELHLQDREINSPHIQFVGTKARLAEQIIAETLVEYGYEASIESAIGKKLIPVYEYNKGFKEESLAKELQREKQEIETNVAYKEAQKELFESEVEYEYSPSIKKQLESIELKRKDFFKILDDTMEEFKPKNAPDYIKEFEKRMEAIDAKRKIFFEILNRPQVVNHSHKRNTKDWAEEVRERANQFLRR